MWSVEFVEVPDETQPKAEKSSKETSKKGTDSGNGLSADHKIPSIHRLCSLEDTVSETTADTTQDYRDQDLLSVQEQEAELGSSVESGGTLTEAMEKREGRWNSKDASPDLMSFNSADESQASQGDQDTPDVVVMRRSAVEKPDPSLDIDKARSDMNNASVPSPPTGFEIVTEKEAKAVVDDALLKYKGTKRKLRPGINIFQYYIHLIYIYPEVYSNFIIWVLQKIHLK